MRNYYLLIDGQQAGPYTAEQLHEMLAQGQVTNESLAWYEGLTEWVQLGTILEPMAAPVAPPSVSIGAGAKPLLTSGIVEVQGNSGTGKILFTDSTFFAFRSEPVPTWAVLFGAIGGLIYALTSAKKGNKAPPAHLDHPEIAALDAPTRKMLATGTMICSFPINAGFSAKPTGMGFVFSTPGYPEVNYKGLIFKKRIVAYLQERGISV